MAAVGTQQALGTGGLARPRLGAARGDKLLSLSLVMVLQPPADHEGSTWITIMAREREAHYLQYTECNQHRLHGCLHAL